MIPTSLNSLCLPYACCFKSWVARGGWPWRMKADFAHKTWLPSCMRGSRKFCWRLSNFDNVFLVDSKHHYKRAIIGPPAKHHLNGVSLMAQHRMLAWWLSDFKGNRASMLRNPIFGDFSGWGSGPPVPIWNPPMSCLLFMKKTISRKLPTFAHWDHNRKHVI